MSGPIIFLFVYWHAQLGWEKGEQFLVIVVVNDGRRQSAHTRRADSGHNSKHRSRGAVWLAGPRSHRRAVRRSRESIVCSGDMRSVFVAFNHFRLKILEFGLAESIDQLSVGQLSRTIDITFH
jgi:hypothetical protein